VTSRTSIISKVPFWLFLTIKGRKKNAMTPVFRKIQKLLLAYPSRPEQKFSCPSSLNFKIYSVTFSEEFNAIGRDLVH
jgi:hypothetical protein